MCTNLMVIRKAIDLVDKDFEINFRIDLTELLEFERRWSLQTL